MFHIGKQALLRHLWKSFTACLLTVAAGREENQEGVRSGKFFTGNYAKVTEK